MDETECLHIRQLAAPAPARQFADQERDDRERGARGTGTSLLPAAVTDATIRPRRQVTP